LDFESWILRVGFWDLHLYDGIRMQTTNNFLLILLNCITRQPLTDHTNKKLFRLHMIDNETYALSCCTWMDHVLTHKMTIWLIHNLQCNYSHTNTAISNHLSAITICAQSRCWTIFHAPWRMYISNNMTNADGAR
jgi:hypothetical protein